MSRNKLAFTEPKAELIFNQYIEHELEKINKRFELRKLKHNGGKISGLIALEFNDDLTIKGLDKI